MQSELGDYDPIEHGTSIDYLRDFDFAPCQSDDLLEKIMEIHRTTLKVSHDLTLRILYMIGWLFESKENNFRETIILY